jgi:hypothetical protein
VAGAVIAWRSGDRRATVWAWQLPTALGLALLSRQLFPRHLVYLVPALAALYATAVMELSRQGERAAERASAQSGDPDGRAAPRDGIDKGRPAAGLGRGLAVALVAALLVPWLLTDRDLRARREDGTWRLGDFIELTTATDEIVLSDYSELNFYGIRPTTYSAASLSAGAAQSGQITWARIAGELDAEGQKYPPLVLVDRTEIEGRQYGHFRFLRDLDAFEAWLANGYEHAGTFVRRLGLPDRQVFEVYVPTGRPLPRLAQFRDGPDLLAGGLPRRGTQLRAGESVGVATAWAASRAITEALALTVRLVPIASEGAGGQGGSAAASAVGQARAGTAGDQAGAGTAVGRADAGTAVGQADAATAVGQIDGSLLAAGEREADQWGAGELTVERLELVVPSGIAPGSYEVVVGVYSRRSGSLLERIDGGPALVPIARVTVGFP